MYKNVWTLAVTALLLYSEARGVVSFDFGDDIGEKPRKI